MVGFGLWLCVGGARTALNEGDAIAEGERDALRFAADAHVAAELPVRVALLLHAHVDEGVLAEHAHRVQIRSLPQQKKKAKTTKTTTTTTTRTTRTKYSGIKPF